MNIRNVYSHQIIIWRPYSKGLTNRLYTCTNVDFHKSKRRQIIQRMWQKQTNRKKQQTNSNKNVYCNVWNFRKYYIERSFRIIYSSKIIHKVKYSSTLRVMHTAICYLQNYEKHVANYKYTTSVNIIKGHNVLDGCMFECIMRIANVVIKLLRNKLSFIAYLCCLHNFEKHTANYNLKHTFVAFQTLRNTQHITIYSIHVLSL